MEQEDKELLLKDLSARLPYGVKCKDQYGDYINVNIYNAHIEHLIDQILSGIVQMALRPMSSMTEEEKEELYHYYCKEIADNLNKTDLSWTIRVCVSDAFGIDWLNAHHFDYRGLIDKGLAIKAKEGMYEKKKA